MTGRFEMGSTIVLIYESDPSTTQTLIREGDKVSLGQPLVLTEPLSQQMEDANELLQDVNTLVQEEQYIRSNWSILKQDIAN